MKLPSILIGPRRHSHLTGHGSNESPCTCGQAENTDFAPAPRTSLGDGTRPATGGHIRLLGRTE